MKIKLTPLDKKKRKTIASVKKKTWVIFSKYIRLRDCLKTAGDLKNGKCITCQRLCRIGEADAGHFISRRYSSTLFDETNVHLQCKQCNKYGGTLVALEYRRQIINLYGEGYDYQLEEKAMEIKKFTIPELEQLAEIYKKKIKELEEHNE